MARSLSAGAFGCFFAGRGIPAELFAGLSTRSKVALAAMGTKAPLSRGISW